MTKHLTCGKLNEGNTKWCRDCGVWVAHRAFAVRPKRKKRLHLWLPSGVILGSFVGLLILGGLACSPDKVTPDGEPPTSANNQVTPSPTGEEVMPGSRLPESSGQERPENVSDYVESTHSMVRDTAVLAVQGSPTDIDANSEAWKIWQINYWVANNISYVSDPKGNNYFAYAHETLQIKGGDCDDFAILLASMYESVGLDAAIANIDTDDDGKTDHMACLVYYPEDGESFIEEEESILEMLGLSQPVRVYYFDPANSKLMPEKYTTGIWIVADPTMAMAKDKVGYITHKPYKATLVIDVSSG